MMSLNKEWKEAGLTLKKLLKQEGALKKDWHDLLADINYAISSDEEAINELLNAFEKELSKHVESKKILPGDDDLLREYIVEWRKYSVLVEYTCQAFSIRGKKRKLPSVKSRNSSNILIIQNCMYRIWNEKVFKTIRLRLLSSSMAFVSKERLGETIDSQLVVGVRQSFVIYSHGKANPLEEYEKYFEKKYIDYCREFYSPRASQILAENGILSYIAYAHEKLEEEMKRSKRYLDMSKPESHNRFVDASFEILVIQLQEQLLAETANLIAENETNSLNTLYGLLNKTANGIQLLLDCLGTQIESEGLQTMRDNAETLVIDPEKYVDHLIALFIKFSTLIKDAFCEDFHFLTIRDKSFQKVVNNTQIVLLELPNQPPESKCPKLLANYCDLLLRKSELTKKLTTEGVKECLEKVLLILKYVNTRSKYLFMYCYKSHLSRRLILELTVDQSMEEELVSKFREIGMPSDFVSKLFRMLQDVEINKDLSAEFKQRAAQDENKAIADCVNLKILNARAWNKDFDKRLFSFPHELAELIHDMQEFYQSKHTGRKLSWYHDWSLAVVEFVSSKGEYELGVNAFQMRVLFCWNDHPKKKISFKQLSSVTKLENEDLICTILSLANNPKVKVQVVLTDLNLPAEGNEITEKDFTDPTMFWINEDFQVMKGDKPQSRGRVNLINILTCKF